MRCNISKANDPYKPGDNCYVVDITNKIKFCEIKKVHKHEGKNISIYYEAVDLVDYKFMLIEHKFCRDTEKEAKALKRAGTRWLAY